MIIMRDRNPWPTIAGGKASAKFVGVLPPRILIVGLVMETDLPDLILLVYGPW
jgi:hypothetical protein